VILDAGFLISIDRGERAAQVAVAAFQQRDTPLRTTHPVLAQVWRSPTQARLGRFVKALDAVHPMDEGKAAGTLLARSGTSDVVDAHLVLVALRTGEPVLTGDVGDLAHLVESSGLPVDVLSWP
jgi:hypothetical protein